MPAVALPPTPPLLLSVTHQHASWIFDRLTPGGRIVALSKGYLSLTDLIGAALKRCGAAHLTICVWNIGDHDIEALTELQATGTILSARFITPPAPEGSRDEQIFARFRELFGPECIIEAACHAKIALVQNDAWNVAIRGSLNMYACGDIESFDIDDSPEICGLVNEYAKDPETVSYYPKPQEAKERAERLCAAHMRAGCRFFGLTAGYDLPSIVRAILATTGPARVSVMTAYLGPKDGAELAALPDSRVCFGRAFVKLDHKGVSAKAAIDSFGPARVRIAMSHAKYVTIRNAAWNITIRSSMNMSRNLRAEQFDITDDVAIAEQAEGLINYFFAETPEGLRVPQTTIGRVMRAALGDVDTGDPSEGYRGPITLPRSEGNRRLLRLLVDLDPLTVLPPILFVSSGTAATTAGTGLCHDSTSTAEATTARGPITLPRAPAGARQLPLLPLIAPRRPGAGRSSPPHA